MLKKWPEYGWSSETKLQILREQLPEKLEVQSTRRAKQQIPERVPEMFKNVLFKTVAR